jgi:hypothetical protein
VVAPQLRNAQHTLELGTSIGCRVCKLTSMWGDGVASAQQLAVMYRCPHVRPMWDEGPAGSECLAIREGRLVVAHAGAACPAAGLLNSDTWTGQRWAAAGNVEYSISLVASRATLRSLLLADLSAVQEAAPAHAIATQDVTGVVDIEDQPFQRIELGGGVGSGLIATRPVPAGTLLGEYAGVLCHPGVLLVGGFDGYTVAYPACDLRGNCLAVTAAHVGNHMRLINHGDASVANARFGTAVVSGIPRQLVITTRHVAPGEQFLIDYGGAYWHAAGFKPTALVA